VRSPKKKKKKKNATPLEEEEIKQINRFMEGEDIRRRDSSPYPIGGLDRTRNGYDGGFHPEQDTESLSMNTYGVNASVIQTKRKKKKKQGVRNLEQ